jgi:hypothetical protein
MEVSMSFRWILLVLIVAAWPGKVMAQCDCGPQTPQVIMGMNPLVFEGEVISDKGNRKSTGTARLRVLEIFKGDVPRTVTATYRVSGRCAIKLTPGTQLVVFGPPLADYVLNLCTVKINNFDNYEEFKQELRDVGPQ